MSAVYLAHLGEPLDPNAEGPWDEVFALTPGLVFVRSELHRSAVYHALKDALPPGAALLVAELDEVPKFKGMAPGALAWARAAIGRSGSD